MKRGRLWCRGFLLGARRKIRYGFYRTFVCEPRRKLLLFHDGDPCTGVWCWGNGVVHITEGAAVIRHNIERDHIKDLLLLDIVIIVQTPLGQIVIVEMLNADNAGLIIGKKMLDEIQQNGNRLDESRIVTLFLLGIGIKPPVLGLVNAALFLHLSQNGFDLAFFTGLETAKLQLGQARIHGNIPK